MSRLNPSTFLRLIPLACLFLSVRAFAQFEIAPDHFDAAPAQAAQSTGATDKASAARPRAGNLAAQPASTRAQQLKQQIAEQQAVLAQYRAQIIAKTEQLDMAWQSLLCTGNEAGEGEAIAIYQRELDKLQGLLAPAIHETEVKVARLQAELGTTPQLATSLPAQRHRF